MKMRTALMAGVGLIAGGCLLPLAPASAQSASAGAGGGKGGGDAGAAIAPAGPSTPSATGVMNSNYPPNSLSSMGTEPNNNWTTRNGQQASGNTSWGNSYNSGYNSRQAPYYSGQAASGQAYYGQAPRYDAPSNYSSVNTDRNYNAQAENGTWNSGPTGANTTVISPNDINVSQLQQALDGHGADVRVDGIWGQNTQDALRNYQQQNGLQVTGEIDQQTLRSLNLPGFTANNNEAMNGNPGQNYNVNSGNNFGMSRQQIAEVQRALDNEGAGVPVNGYWNSNTENAVRNYQQQQGLDVTGQLDRQTLESLNLPGFTANNNQAMNRNFGPNYNGNSNYNGAGNNFGMNRPGFTANSNQAMNGYPGRNYNTPSNNYQNTSSAYGSTGDAQQISQLQRALDNQGANLQVNGSWDPNTENALRTYQQQHGLQATGQLDQQTRQRLNLGG